ncbi:MAG: TRAP transporter substrate-binding protein [Oscillospiraceae bacterium]|nr:TRAP transporter substrate-binding protein [Oscillospiraceae bacterium]
MKKILALLLALTMVFALAACGQQAAPAPAEKPAEAPADKPAEAPVDDTVYTLNFYHIFAAEESGGHESLWINKAVEEVAKQSNGRLVINVGPGGTMGSEEELIPQVFSGDLDMSLSGPSVWGTVGQIDAIGWSELPYVVDNYSQMNALGEILPDLTNKQLEEAGIGLYCLGAMSQGIRCLCTVESAKVETVDDCKGLRIRVPQSDVYEATVAGWGCAPTAMSSSQVITSLANGTIEGLESDPASILARGQQEAFHWYIETYHIASLNLLMINKANLEALPADLQEILISVFKDYCVQQCYDREIVNNALLDDIKAAGVEVITPTPEAFEAFKSADTPFRDQKIAEWGDEAIFQEALDYVAANAK